MKCPKCGQECYPTDKNCFACGAPLPESGVTQEQIERGKIYEYPMRWYHFLIYFYLIFIAVGSAVQGVLMILGAPFYSFLYYATIPLYRWLNITFGVIYILLAVCALVTRQKLAQYRRSAPGWMIGYLVFSLMITIGYTVIFSRIPGVEGMAAMDLSFFLGCGMQIVVLILNVIYFRNRSDSFIN